MRWGGGDGDWDGGGQAAAEQAETVQAGSGFDAGDNRG